MSRDFLSFLPPEKAKTIKDKVKAEMAEAYRLHALPDRWLGEAVMAMARKVRERHPDLRRRDAPSQGYNSGLVWEVVPYLAKRLGCVTRYDEATDADLATLDGAELREYVGTVLRNVSGMHMDLPLVDAADRRAAAMLVHSVANGNPVAMMLDRVVPPHASSNDWCATHVREISRVRGVGVRSAWDPGMQGKRDPSHDLDDSGATVHALPVDGIDDSGATLHVLAPVVEEDEATPPFGM